MTLQKNKSRRPQGGKAAAVLLAALLLVTLAGCSNETSSGDGGQDVQLSPQPDWSQWSDSLPGYVSAEQHQIETRREYRSRALEMASSTESDTMNGWELYSTMDQLGNFGAWSEWSMEAIQSSDTRQVETQTRYRYRDKDRTTSNTANQEGWELENTTYAMGDYGGWSDWSATAVSSSEDRQVELKTQYRSRSIRYESGYGDWGAWSEWSEARVEASQTCQVEIRTVDSGTQYRFRTRAYIENKPVYGEWGAYGDTALAASSSLQVETRIVYRSRTRQQVATYHYWRWGAWSNWLEDAVGETYDRQVETTNAYRYRDQLTDVTYYFRRWGEWSEFSGDPIKANETLQVEVNTEYRYKDK